MSGSIDRRQMLLLPACSALASLIGMSPGAARAQERNKVRVVANIAYGEITNAVFSGRDLLLGSRKGTVQLWDTDAGRLVRTYHAKLTAEHTYVTAIAMSTKSGHVVASDRYAQISVWDLSTGELMSTLQERNDHWNALTAAFFYPDGRWLHAITQSTITTYDTSTWRAVHTINKGGYVAAISTDGNHLLLAPHISGFQDVERVGWGIEVLDVWNGVSRGTFRGHYAQINAIAVSRGGQRVVSGSGRDDQDNTVRVWGAGAPGRLDWRYSPIHSVAFSADEARVAALSKDGIVSTWNATTGAPISSESLAGEPLDFDFDLGNGLLAPDAGAVFGRTKKGTLTLWATDSGQRIRTLGTSLGSVSMVAISRDGSRLLCACRVENGYLVHIWSMATGTLMADWPIVGRAASISAIAFSPDGRFAATGTADDETGGDDRRRTGSPPGRRRYAIIIWDLSTGIPARSHFGQTAEVLAFSPDGSRILAAAGHAATLLDWRTGRSIWTLRPRQPQASYSALAFSPDGRYVLAAALVPDAPEVEVFDIATRTRIRSLSGAKGFIASIAVSPDGSRVIAGDWGLSINIWSMSTRALPKRIACDDRVFSVAFSPDGRKILSGGRDVAARLWDADSGQAIHVMPGETSAEINSVAFSPDGTRAVSGHSDGTVKMWQADTGEEVLTLLYGASGDWLALTPEGFLNGTERAAQRLSLADRLQARPVGDAYRALYRPDLVRAKLAGDPRGEVQEAASKLDLAKFSAGAPRRD